MVSKIAEELYQDGIAEGRALGRKEGRKEGREEGRLAVQLAVAKTMLIAGRPTEKVVAYTGLTPAQVDGVRTADGRAEN